MSDKVIILKAAISFNKTLIDQITSSLDTLNKDTKFNELTLLVTEKRISVINSLKKQVRAFKSELEEIKKSDK